MPVITNWIDLIQRATNLLELDRRVLLGITGPPGAGKSTLAKNLKTALGESVQVVEMDGFHLSTERLRDLGRLDRMGAIDTFDASGFVALVRRVRDQGGSTVYAPKFRRDTGASTASAIVIEASAKLVVVEGNYLLASEKPWDELRVLLDEVWYCERDETSRLEGLIARHRKNGHTESEARRWAIGSDQRNANQIIETRSRADIIVALDLQRVRKSEFEESVDSLHSTEMGQS